jgi:hypothetical protein
MKLLKLILSVMIVERIQNVQINFIRIIPLVTMMFTFILWIILFAIDLSKIEFKIKMK